MKSLRSLFFVAGPACPVAFRVAARLVIPGVQLDGVFLVRGPYISLAKYAFVPNALRFRNVMEKPSPGDGVQL